MAQGGMNFLSSFGFNKGGNVSDDEDLTNRNDDNKDQNSNRQNLNGNNDDNDDNDSGEGDDNLLENFVDLDNESGDFDIDPNDFDEDEDDGTPPDPNLPDPDKQLITEMQNMIKSVRISQEDLPADLNLSDPKSLSGFMTKMVQTAIQNAVGVMAKPMQAALESQEKSFQKAMKSQGQVSDVKRRMEQAFAPIGESLRNDKVSLALGKELFQKAYRKTKDPKQAAQATAKMMRGLGKVVNLGLRNTGNNSQQYLDDDSGGDQYAAGPARREGVAALDHFAPLPRKKP